MRTCSCAALIVFASSCAGPHRLDERWRPLEEVVERPDLLLTDAVATTLGTRIYVPDLKAWRRRYPDGSPEQEALLLHEQEHAVRQLAAGLGPWLARYLNDPVFMWREEQRGWALEIRRRQTAGRPVVAEVVALTLTGYRNLTGRMVGYPEALAFVRAVVLNGTWTPPPEAP